MARALVLERARQREPHLGAERIETGRDDLALQRDLGFVMIRKKAKLPGATIPYTYDLEYGSDTIEIQANAIQPGQKVVVLDDILATGGTMNASVQLLRSVGAEVTSGAGIIELTFLKGRERLDIPFTSILTYDE